MLSELQQSLIHADGPGFALLVAGLLVVVAGGLYGFLRYSRLLRLIADTPTARIRSAPQGFVQFDGTADWLPGPEIHAPLSMLPCVWYRYRVEDGGGGTRRRRTVVEQGRSGDLFRLRDGTGECVVDPDGAMVIRPDRDVWHGTTRSPDRGPGAGSRWFGGRYRYVEERLRAHERILVAGEFSTRHHVGLNHHERMRDLLGRWKNDPAIIRRFDSDGDGRLSVKDWEAVRAAARIAVDRAMVAETQPDAIHLIRRGEHGSQRVLLLSTLDESQLLFRQRLWAYGSAVIFIAAASLLLWAVTVRY
jgi:hypothetical protein